MKGNFEEVGGQLGDVLQLPILLEYLTDSVVLPADSARLEMTDRIPAVDMQLGGVIFYCSTTIQVFTDLLANDRFNHRSAAWMVEVT